MLPRWPARRLTRAVHPADVLAATRPSQVEVVCFQRPWQLDLSTGAEWVGAIGYDLETLAGIFPGAIRDEDLDAMWDLCGNPDASRRWLNAARMSVQRGSGRDWWWTVNLVRKVMGIWPYINGQLLLRNVDAATMTFPSWLDAAFMLLWTNADEQGRTKLDLELSMRPQGVAVKMSGAQKRKMMEAFAAD